MGNCLVTKLKGTVQNDELLPLGSLRLKFKQNQFNNAKSQYFTIGTQGSQQPVTVKLVGDGYLTTDINVPTSQKEFTIPANDNLQLFVSNTTCFIDIFPAYEINQFFVGVSGDGEGNVKEIVNEDIIKYMSNLSRIFTSEAPYCHVDLAWLTSPVLHTLNAKYGGCFGELSALEGKTLDEVQLRGSYLTGSLDSLLNTTPLAAGNYRLLSLENTPNVYKKRSTITALQAMGYEVLVTPEEVDEDN